MLKRSKVFSCSRDCQIQSLAIGNYAFSFQFHLEITPTTVDEWAEVENINFPRITRSKWIEKNSEDAAIHLSYFNSCKTGI